MPRIARLAAALLAAAAVLLAACGVDEPTNSSALAQTESPSGPIERASAAAVEESIVRIVAFGCGTPAVGTGFAVDTNLIITNAHIISGRDPETLSVQQIDGDEFAAVIVGFDADLDLALLRVDGAEFAPLNLVTEVPIVDGVAIAVRSQNQENNFSEIDFSVDAPVIINWDGVFSDTESTFRGIRVDADIQRGDSGSPLLINDRDVIGLVQSTTRGQPRGYAVRSSEIVGFVDSIDDSVAVVASRCA